MISGIPYDSNEARAVSASITAIMTGTAYKTSAEMAGVLGAFNKYAENRNHMLRVIRNHRYAAYYANDAFEDLEVIPNGIDAKYCPDYLLRAACKTWDSALECGEQNGFRNAQVSAIAPTGTIGLLMDCDTTGVEPDFSLVKFKKLSGGGYFRIVNESVPAALKNLGYNKHEVKSIINYVNGRATFKGAPYINYETLASKGFTREEVEILNAAATSAFDIAYIFNVWTLGEDCLKRLGFTKERYSDLNFILLTELGFTPEQIEETNQYVCGTMTVEGAPYLKSEHLSVFDCANRCGKTGTRFIHPSGHILMMASVQPFISGAISKTINLPNESTEKDIEDCYMNGWKSGLKAVAIYRDGSKLSQPLSSKSDKKENVNVYDSNEVDREKLTAEDVLEAARRIIHQTTDTKFKRQLSNIVHRKKLPEKRGGFTQKAKIGGHTIFVRTGEYTEISFKLFCNFCFYWFAIWCSSG